MIIIINVLIIIFIVSSRDLYLDIYKDCNNFILLNIMCFFSFLIYYKIMNYYVLFFYYNVFYKFC